MILEKLSGRLCIRIPTTFQIVQWESEYNSDRKNIRLRSENGLTIFNHKKAVQINSAPLPY
ncbi:hypothetical protein A8990_12362 [Paenibacillus taihuensis]|uniref:Uncharacterized protein n=1 Tax=Paenibacillus taihuensis TaxID=1156355 RepID=A0A3D9RSI5_9BACL|nr:hypothetical protein A8990_12362 [Paenibacillus taihuensis]